MPLCRRRRRRSRSRRRRGAAAGPAGPRAAAGLLRCRSHGACPANGRVDRARRGATWRPRRPR
eukprot:10028776-Lingulodinium_polyedra.AAC.1